MSNSIIQLDLARIAAAPLDWDWFRRKTVLVTGASGFLAAYMVEALLEVSATRDLDTKVIALVRNHEKARVRYKKYENSASLRLLVQDVCDPISFTERIDVIIHAASQASPRYYRTDPVGTLMPNVYATAQLLRFAQQNSVENFLFFSSSEVYGNTSLVEGPVTEAYVGNIDQTDIRSCYAESKRMGETMCLSWHYQHGVPAKIVRPFHTYGPGVGLDDGRIFADIISSFVRNVDIQLTGDGSAIRSYCYSADAVLGYFSVLLKGENGQAYNVGNDEQSASVSELIDRVFSAFPERKIGIKRVAPSTSYYASTVNKILPSTRKLRALGWLPGTSIEDGFRRTILSYQS